MPFFSKVFKHKDGPRSSSRVGKNADEHAATEPSKPRWEESWTRKEVSPEEVQELIHICTQEMKSRALDMPFLLLPFRPNVDPGNARSFIRNFFKAQYEGSSAYSGANLQQELRLTEPLDLCSIMKWCWSRLPGGVVTWDAYELFKVGEQDSKMARNAFHTFIPLSVDSDARKQIIFDFFDLLSAIAARGKTNGLGGRKLSRMAGWWAFELSDQGKGFDGGYKSWAHAADACSHLFFAYLRSLSPDPKGINSINTLPRSLEALVAQTEYPPETPALMHSLTPKVVMIVDSVSPTPFALLRRAKHFEYRDDDRALQKFSSYEDPIKALTDECRRVLNCIASTNQSESAISPIDGGMPEPSWSRFEDLGFSGLLDSDTGSMHGSSIGERDTGGLRQTPRSRANLGRPTTPSWADFLSTGFADEHGRVAPAPMLLPPDKILPPIGGTGRVQSSQSHVRYGQDDDLEPGELASVTHFDLDETFWWVWMTSLAGEEPAERKAVFGRCALIETTISGAKWLVIEEQVKGASPGPEEGAYIAEKKGLFSFTRRGRLGRRKSTGKKPQAALETYHRGNTDIPASKTSIGPDQHARIQAAAAKLAQKEQEEAHAGSYQRRGRNDDAYSTKTNSVMTLQPGVLSEAAPALKWAKEFDKDVIRAKYLGDPAAGKGSKDLVAVANGAPASPLSKGILDRELPAPPSQPNGAIQRKQVQTPVQTPSATHTPPPAPLPVSPRSNTVDLKKLEAASAAAQVPLPTGTPVEEKPAVPMDHYNQHPAFRNQASDFSPAGPVAPVPISKERQEPAPTHPKPADEIKKSWESQPSSNDVPSKKTPPHKLKKHTPNQGGGGFRRFLGIHKKSNNVDRLTTPEPYPRNDATLNIPQGTVSRGKSLLRRKASPTDEAVGTEDETGRTTPTQPPALQPSPIPAERPAQSQHPSATYNAQKSNAEEDFSRFDQGPLNDAPQFVPESDEDLESIEPQSAAPYDSPDPHYPHNQSPSEIRESNDDFSSEESIDLSRQISPSQDRWAQIRRNAAERAARASEDVSRRSHSQSVRTDEGETSGEETIESRVARIKARVAELTGNIESQPVHR